MRMCVIFDCILKESKKSGYKKYGRILLKTIQSLKSWRLLRTKLSGMEEQKCGQPHNKCTIVHYLIFKTYPPTF